VPEDLKLDRMHPAYAAQAREWDRARDCYDGGSRIEGRAEYLPKHERETESNYRSRLQRAVYTNFCLPIVENFTGQIWRNAPARTLPEALEPLEDDVDRQGAPANAFFKSVTQNAQVEGLRYVLVDYPDTRGVASRGEERARRIRPYFVDLDPRRVLDWSFVTGDDGALRLAWVVVREDVEPEAEPFRGRKTEHRYRLWRPESWELWRKDDSGRAQLVEEGRNTLGEIPLTAFYSDYAGPFTGRSALAGVVSLCLAHYRKWSDRDNSEFWAGMPTWVFKNWPEDSEIVIGSGNGIVTPTRDSTVEIIEHSGSAIESMRQTETDIISAIYEIAMRQVRRTTRAVMRRMDELEGKPPKYADLERRRGDLASPKQLRYLEWLWAQCTDARIEPEERAKNLRRFLSRRFGTSDVRFLSAGRAWAAIEALKAIRRRKSAGG